MDAIFLLIVKNKEFGTLVVIMFFTIAQYFQNKGQFELHLEKIKNIGDKADKADKKSDKALEIVMRVETSTSKIQETVQEIKDGYSEFIKEKNRNKINAIQEET